MKLFYVLVYIILNQMLPMSCWQYFTKLSDIVLSNSFPDPEHTHSEYVYGDCKRKDKVYYTQIHVNHLEVLGKVIMRAAVKIPHSPFPLNSTPSLFTPTNPLRSPNIILCVQNVHVVHPKTPVFPYWSSLPVAYRRRDVQGWLNIKRIPTCIILRATAYEYDLFRSTAYNFQICVPRITYCHSQKRFKYYYYEWYIPIDLVGGMDWDIIFFGPSSEDWQ